MKLVLAPLADYTDGPFRRLCGENGADLAYTEMISAAALAHGHTPTDRMLERMPGEGPLACQVFGAEASDLAAAARRIESIAGRFVELNLNAGCPMTRVTRCGAGAKLAEDPARVARLLTVLRENCSLPVTLKTRLGPHPQRTTAFELLDAAEGAGAAGVIFHARYASQLHAGRVCHEVLAELVGRAHVPVTGNGSVTDAASFAAMAATGVSAVMVGRAALSDPRIFRRLRGEACEGPGSLLMTHLGYLLDFHAQLVTAFPDGPVPSLDGHVAQKMRTHLFRYLNGRPGAAKLRARINGLRTLAEIDALLREVNP